MDKLGGGMACKNSEESEQILCFDICRIFTKLRSDCHLKKKERRRPIKYLPELRNLVLGEQNELKNRYLHIHFQSDKTTSSKGQIDTLNVTLEERAVLNCVLADAKMTQQEIAQQIRKSPRTVKRIMASLSEKQIIIRKNGKRNGWWEVLIALPNL